MQAASVPDGMEIGIDFPMVCERCLGDSRFVRMMRLPQFTACKITGQPFQPFRWRPSRNGAARETIICYEVSAEKNVCQCCLNDIDYNIPMALRDSFEAVQKSMHHQDQLDVKTGVNREFSLKHSAAIRKAGKQNVQIAPSYRLLDKAADLELQVNKQNRKLPGLCSNWIRGSCLREQCTFRPCGGAYSFPEVAETFPQETSQLIERLKAKGPSGVSLSNPALKRALIEHARQASREAKAQALMPPEDETITSVFVRNIPSIITEEQIMKGFAEFGEITKLQYNQSNSNAFVQFESRADAEKAMSTLEGKITIHGHNLKVVWVAKRKTTEPAPLLNSKKMKTMAFKSDTKATKLPKQENLPQEGKSKIHPNVPKATPIYELAPQVPVPYGLMPGDSLPPPPAGLLDGLMSQKIVIPTDSLASTPQDLYPSLNPVALAGRLPIV